MLKTPEYWIIETIKDLLANDNRASEIYTPLYVEVAIFQMIEK